MDDITKIDLVYLLRRVPAVCAYVLYDKFDNTGYLQWSNGNALNSICKNISLLDKGIHSSKSVQQSYDRGRLGLKVIYKSDEPLPDDLILRVKAILAFQQSGYIDTTKKHHKIEYTVSKRIRRLKTEDRRHWPRIYILLKSHSPEAIVLAIFDNINDADTFLMLNYPGQVDSLVFSRNKDTAEYHSKYGYRLVNTSEEML